MKLIGRVHNARVYTTFHGRFRILTRRNKLINPEDDTVDVVIYNNPWDDGVFIHRLFQWWLCHFKGYHVEYWGFSRTRTLVKRLK